MGQKMTWSEMCDRFPDEWVAVANYVRQGGGPYGEIEGELLVHHPDKFAFYDAVGKLPVTIGPLDLRYTGALFPESDIPLLWQIFPTSLTDSSPS